MKKPKIHHYFTKLSYCGTWYPTIRYRRLLWKDKYGTPRCEVPPNVEISWLWWEWIIVFGSSDYWEQRLWVTHYNNGDITAAKDTWPWSDIATKKSSWEDDLL